MGQMEDIRAKLLEHDERISALEEKKEAKEELAQLQAKRPEPVNPDEDGQKPELDDSGGVVPPPSE